MNDLTKFSEADLQALLTQLQEKLPEILAAISAVLIVIGIIASVILLIGYILRSAAIARIAHRRGIPLWGLAWVPGLRMITLGGIADDHDRKTIGRRHGFCVLLPVLLFIGLIAIVIDGFMFKAQFESFVKAVTADPNSFFQSLSLLTGGKIRGLLYGLAGAAFSILSVSVRSPCISSSNPARGSILS